MSDEIKIVYRLSSDSPTFTWNEEVAKQEMLKYLLGTYLQDNLNSDRIDDVIQLEDMIDNNEENPNFNSNQYSTILSNGWKKVKEMNISELEEELQLPFDQTRGNPFLPLLERNRDITIIDINNENKRSKILGATGSDKGLLTEKEDGWDKGSDYGDNFNAYFEKVKKVEEVPVSRGNIKGTMRKFSFKDDVKQKVKKLNDIGFIGVKQVTRKVDLQNTKEQVIITTSTKEGERVTREKGKSKGQQMYDFTYSSDAKDKNIQTSELDNAQSKLVTIKRNLKLLEKIQGAVNALVYIEENQEEYYDSILDSTRDKNAKPRVDNNKKTEFYRRTDIVFDLQVDDAAKEMGLVDEIEKLKDYSTLLNSKNKVMDTLIEYLYSEMKEENKIYKTLTGLFTKFKLTIEKYSLKEKKKLGADGKNSAIKAVQSAIDKSFNSAEKVYIALVDDFPNIIKEKVEEENDKRKEIEKKARDKQKEFDKKSKTSETTKKEAEEIYEDIEAAGKKQFNRYMNDIDGIYECSISVVKEDKPEYTENQLATFKKIIDSNKANETNKPVVSGKKTLSLEEGKTDWNERLEEARKEVDSSYRLDPINILLISTLEINEGPAALLPDYQTKVQVDSKGKALKAKEKNMASKAFARIRKRLKTLKNILGD